LRKILLCKSRWIPVSGFVLLVGSFHPLAAQNTPKSSGSSSTVDTSSSQHEQEVLDEPERRRMWRTYREARPSGVSVSPQVTNRMSRNRQRHRRPAQEGVEEAKTDSRADPATVEDGFVGLTLWRMRSATATEIKESRSFRQKKQGGLAWTPVRMATGDVLTDGQLTRLSIESARQGYLYIINREEYADGTLGEPSLIFPTMSARDGDNLVSAGVVVGIPDQKDDVPYFTVERSKPNQTGEVLLLILAPKPIVDPNLIGDEPLVLPIAKVEEWEKLWGVEVKRLNDPAAVGKALTPEEKEATVDKNRKLKENDPIPETIYRIPAKFGDPMLVRVNLRYSQPKSTN
jgi:hypothetical protein